MQNFFYSWEVGKNKSLLALRYIWPIQKIVLNQGNGYSCRKCDLLAVIFIVLDVHGQAYGGDAAPSPSWTASTKQSKSASLTVENLNILAAHSSLQPLGAASHRLRWGTLKLVHKRNSAQHMILLPRATLVHTLIRSSRLCRPCDDSFSERIASSQVCTQAKELKLCYL